MWNASEVTPYPRNSPRIGAPRRRARSSSSNTRIPAASPIESPRRSRSKGRQGSGSTDRSELKPPYVSRASTSEPPVTTASARPPHDRVVRVPHRVRRGRARGGDRGFQPFEAEPLRDPIRDRIRKVVQDAARGGPGPRAARSRRRLRSREGPTSRRPGSRRSRAGFSRERSSPDCDYRLGRGDEPHPVGARHPPPLHGRQESVRDVRRPRPRSGCGRSRRRRAKPVESRTLRRGGSARTPTRSSRWKTRLPGPLRRRGGVMP